MENDVLKKKSVVHFLQSLRLIDTVYGYILTRQTHDYVLKLFRLTQFLVKYFRDSWLEFHPECNYQNAAQTTQKRKNLICILQLSTFLRRKFILPTISIQNSMKTSTTTISLVETRKQTLDNWNLRRKFNFFIWFLSIRWEYQSCVWNFINLKWDWD